MTLPTQALSLEEYRHILRADLTSFIQCAFHELNAQGPYVPGDHIEVIASKLEACRRGEIRRLIINLPPRNLKSICASIAFTAWLLGHKPTLNIICASYGQELAEKLARDTRTVMTSSWYRALFPTRMGDRQAVHDFNTSQGGGRMATSVGGVLTGRGADFIILDDPIKPDDAVSDSQRKSTNEWYDNSLLSRLNDKATGCIIIVMQRLHQDDLVGYVLEKDDWEVLSFPAIAEAEEAHHIESPLGKRLFRRQPGEALHPARESLETLIGIRRGGAMVRRDWLKYYEKGSEPSRFTHIFQSWDTANKAGELNDFSVCTTWGVVAKYYYLLDVFRRRLNYPELKRAVVELSKRHPGCTILIEDKASGTQLIQELKRENLRVRAYSPPPGNDKVMRLHAQTLYFENGCVLLPHEAPWLADYVAELTGFPNAKYDDQVDSTTQFLEHISKPGAMPLIISEEALRRLREMPPRRHSLMPYYNPRFW